MCIPTLLKNQVTSFSTSICANGRVCGAFTTLSEEFFALSCEEVPPSNKIPWIVEFNCEPSEIFR